jgi:hypothetical protein
MHEDLDMMLAALRGGATVVLDTESHNSIAGSAHVASEIAHQRLERMRAGERVAWLYPTGHSGALNPNASGPEWTHCMSVTREQARKLVAAGAKWIGHEQDVP